MELARIGKKIKLSQAKLSSEEGQLIIIPSNMEIKMKENKEENIQKNEHHNIQEVQELQELHEENKEDLKASDKEGLKQPYRAFRKEWKNTFLWLEYDNDKGLMYCSWCRKCKYFNALANGSNRFAYDSLTEHEKTEEHKKSIPDSYRKEFIKTFFQKDVHKEAIINMMKGALFLAKEAIANKKFTNLCNLLEDLGVLITKTAYRNFDGYNEFIEAISFYIEDDILERIRIAPAYGLMMDESIDNSQEKHAILFCKYYDEKKCEFKTSFLKLFQMEDSRGVTLYSAIKEYLLKHKLDPLKIVGVCTDGASNMRSEGLGLLGYMIKENPAIEFTHCVLHRVNLALSDVKKEIPYLLKYESILRNIHGYFSSIRTMEFKRLFEKHEEPFLKMKNVFTVRFVYLFDVVQRIKTTYKEVYEYFDGQKDDDSLANSIYLEICSCEFVFATSLLYEILGMVKSVCDILSKENITPYFALLQIDTLTEKLKVQYKEKSLDITNTFCEEIKDGKYKNCIITVKPNYKNDCITFVNNITDLLINFLKERFPENEIIYCSNIFELDCISEEELNYTFGNAELEKIMKRFQRCENESWPPNHLSQKILIEEWNNVKLLARRLKHEGNKNIQNFILNQGKEIYPNFVQLLKICKSIPISTVDVERAFSSRSVIKTKYRKTLTGSQLDHLLRIQIEAVGREEKSLIDSALGKWEKMKKRQYGIIINIK